MGGLAVGQGESARKEEGGEWVRGPGKSVVMDLKDLGKGIHFAYSSSFAYLLCKTSFQEQSTIDHAEGFIYNKRNIAWSWSHDR